MKDCTRCIPYGETAGANSEITTAFQGITGHVSLADSYKSLGMDARTASKEYI